MQFDRLPEVSDPFSVCLSMESKIGREIGFRIKIVDERNRRVGHSEALIDFRGRTLVHDVIAFPKMMFKEFGKYEYVVERDQKEVARFPLFVVKRFED